LHATPVELEHADDLVGDDADLERGETNRSPRIERVWLELEPLPAIGPNQPKGPGTQGHGLRLAGERRREDAESGRIEEWGERLAERHHDRGRIGRLDARQHG